jgi:hypothetical protein
MAEAAFPRLFSPFAFGRLRLAKRLAMLEGASVSARGRPAVARAAAWPARDRRQW